MDLRKREDVIQAVEKGLAHGDKHYTKPYDKAICVIVALDQAGLKIVRKPKEAKS